MSTASLRRPGKRETVAFLSDQVYRVHSRQQGISSYADVPLITMEAPDPFRIRFGSDVVFKFDQAPPKWFMPILNKICELGDLSPGWDSYGAMPIDPKTVVFAINLLLIVLTPSDPLPAVVPTSRGGVMFEWHDGGIDFEIDVRSPYLIHVAFVDGTREEEFEKPPIKLIRERLSTLRGKLANVTGTR